MLLPRVTGVRAGDPGTTDPSAWDSALWDFAYTLASADVSLKYFDFPASEPDMLAGGEPHVIGIVNGIAQHLGDYTVLQNAASKWRRLAWGGLGLDVAPTMQAGDKIWVIYPVKVASSGVGSGGSGTDDHESLDNLYPSSIGSGRHNHLTDAQLASLITIIENWTTSPTATNHEALANLLPSSIGTGPHYHLSQAMLDFLEELMGTPGNDDPTLPGYVPRGHEELAQLLPAGLAAGNHYHLTKAERDSLSDSWPETPDITAPLDRSSILYEGWVAE